MDCTMGCEVTVGGSVMVTVIFFTVVELLVSSLTDTVALVGSDSVGIVKLTLTTVLGRGTVVTLGVVVMIPAEKAHTQK